MFCTNLIETHCSHSYCNYFINLTRHNDIISLASLYQGSTFCIPDIWVFKQVQKFFSCIPDTDIWNFTWCEIIRIYHECEAGIEKSVQRITIWHHEASRVMKNGDREGWIYLSHAHTTNGFFFLVHHWLLLLKVLWSVKKLFLNSFWFKSW